MDPRYLPIDDASADAPATRADYLPPLPRTTPHIGHALLFAFLVLLASILIGIGFALTMQRFAHFVHETGEQMQTDPRVVIPLEAVMYAVAAAASLLIFPLLWGRSFAQGVHWRAAAVERRWWLLAGIGIATSIVVQVLSNFLPIPKELPIDKFFTNRFGVWLVAIFGVTVAPAFEELAFRGFLLPSLASAWDWLAQRKARQGLLTPQTAVPVEWTEQPSSSAGELLHQLERQTSMDAASPSLPSTAGLEADPVLQAAGTADPRWSLPAVVFSTIITSVGFALLHGGQLAHSLAPLSVLFVVSLVLCITRLRFQSLAASTLVHSLYNATIFFMLFLGTDGFRHLDKLSK